MPFQWSVQASSGQIRASEAVSEGSETCEFNNAVYVVFDFKHTCVSK
jgi:hypothetical protein